MKKILLASVAAVAFCAPAFAADMPVKAPVYKAAPAPVFSWTGCYVGANIGGGWARDRYFDDLGGGHTFVGEPKSSGVVGGGQLGCDYQTGPWVFGVEGMFDWSGISGSTFDPLLPALIEHDKIKWFGTATARVGYAVDRSLIYIKGGGAWVNTHSFDNDSSVFDNTRTAAGWTIGGGWEYAFAPNWSMKIEYDHMDLGLKHGLFNPGTPESWQQTVDVVLVGFNYRFSTGKGPVVAKY
jgi:outer membrane immunogenic protein